MGERRLRRALVLPALTPPPPAGPGSASSAPEAVGHRAARLTHLGVLPRRLRRLRSGGRIVEQRCRNREQKDNEAQEAQITQKIANDTE
jgi:hypothetical protein